MLEALRRSPVKVADGVRGVDRRGFGAGRFQLVRLRLLLPLAAVGLVLVLGLPAAYLAWRNYTSERDDVVEQLQRDASNAALTASVFVQGSLQTLIGIAASPSLRSGDDARISDYLAQLDPPVLGFSGGLGYFDNTGRLHAITSRRVADGPTDYSDRDYIQAVIASGRPAVSNAVLTRTDERPVVALAVPVAAAPGTKPAVLGGSVRLDGLDSFSARFARQSGRVLITDGAGNLMVEGGPVSSLISVNESPLYRRVLAANEGAVNGATGLDGEHGVVAGFALVPGTEWHVVVEQAQSDAFGDISNRLRAELTALALAATAIVAGAAWSGRRLDRQGARAAAAHAETEAALDRFRILTDAVPAFVIEHTADGTHAFTNRRFAEYTGRPTSEHWEDLVHPDDFGAIVRRPGPSGGSEWDSEFRLRGADGRYRWFLGRGATVPDSAGKTATWIGSAVDIHDRKLAEEALLERERELQQLVDSIPAIVFVADEQNTIRVVNRHAIDFVDGNLEAFTHWGTSGLVHPDDAGLFAQVAGDPAHPGEAFEAEVRLRRHDGQYRWHAWSSVPVLDRDGRVVRRIRTGLDVHERKLAEDAAARLAAVVTSAQDGIMTVGLDGRIQTWNAGCEAIYGFPAREAVGRAKPEVVGATTATAHHAIEQHLARALAGERSVVERTDHRHDGSEVRVQVVASPIQGADGRVIALSAIVRDVSAEYARHEREQQQQRQIAALNTALEERLTELERAMAVKDEFLGSVSHELRTPLTSLVGLVHMLERRGEGVDAGARREAIEQMATDADRLQLIIENMLILARLDHSAFEPEPLLVQRDAPRAVEAHRQRYPGRKLVVDLPGALPTVWAQAQWFDQVLTNLLSNAEKYTPADGEVTVAARECGGFVEVQVLDRGPGISEADASAVFEPFHRLERDRYRGPGSGLGLAVCRRLVEIMGGTITATPRPGGGATFAFTLPIAEDAGE